ncbi:MAG TPA: hydroxyacid dehydrogenase [Anaerolineae bacterium]
MPKVLVSDSIAREGVEILRRHAQVVVDDKITTDALMLAIPEYDALVVRSRTKVIAPVIDAATRLRVIGRAGVGVDNIDCEAAARRGIAVVNSPASAMVSVAEHTMGLMVALARFIPQADASLRKGGWEKNKFLGIELSGKTLGIVGLGRIGSMVAVRAEAFGMRVLTYDPYIKGERAETFGTTLLESLDDLLAMSDFVSIHTPLMPTTRGLIDADELAKMKRGARLISCARGGVVDEKALLAALESGHLAGAALDVFETEPPGDNPLLKHPRVVVTPHLGAMTEEAQTRAAVDVAEQVVEILKRQT